MTTSKCVLYMLTDKSYKNNKLCKCWELVSHVVNEDFNLVAYKTKKNVN